MPRTNANVDKSMSLQTTLRRQEDAVRATKAKIKAAKQKEHLAHMESEVKRLLAREVELMEQQRVREDCFQSNVDRTVTAKVNVQLREADAKIADLKRALVFVRDELPQVGTIAGNANLQIPMLRSVGYTFHADAVQASIVIAGYPERAKLIDDGEYVLMHVRGMTKVIEVDDDGQRDRGARTLKQNISYDAIIQRTVLISGIKLMRDLGDLDLGYAKQIITALGFGATITFAVHRTDVAAYREIFEVFMGSRVTCTDEPYSKVVQHDDPNTGLALVRRVPLHTEVQQ